MDSSGRGRWVAAAAIAATLLMAPDASALSKVAVEATDLGGGFFHGEARCRGDQHVVSGGFRADSGAFAIENRHEGKRRWSVTVQGGSTPTVYAYCSRRLNPSHPQEGPHGTGKDPVPHASVLYTWCRRGKEAVAGGWSVDPSLTVFKFRRVHVGRHSDSFFAGRSSWVMTAAVHTKGDTFTGYASCLRRVDVTVRKSKDRVSPGADGAATARCKRGEELLGGGFFTRPHANYSNQAGPDLVYSASARKGRRGWRASAHNNSDEDAGAIIASAICRT